MAHDVLLNKAATIERAVRRACEEYAAAGAGFGSDFTHQDAALMNIQRACEAAVDMANHLVRRDRLGVPQSARGIIDDERNEAFVSAASTWEIAITKFRGKLSGPEGSDAIIEDDGFTPLPVSLFHGERAGVLPPLHPDPFERMLVAQAQAEGLELMSSDARLTGYDVGFINV